MGVLLSNHCVKCLVMMSTATTIMSLVTVWSVTHVTRVSAVYPVVTWHGIGSDSGECNRLIETIRGLAERCPVPTKTLITFGSPHQGVFGVPDCVETLDSYLLCEMVRQLISAGAYTDWIQNLITPAQYWQDPLNITNFREGSHYLAPINNNVDNKTEIYKTRIQNLVNFVMVMFNQDDVVTPIRSSWFEFYT